ncbi:MAG TPA: hypothetical protein VK012_04080, partial [Gemmatimonadales bacterium]|nr:hypothetical protein [Gemmatimonadales bacterium]
ARMSAAPTPESLVPELGPLLGRLSVPRGSASGLVPLDDIRLKLVSELFDLAGAAREFAASGDTSAAVQSLNRHGWLAAWERAVAAAAERVAARIQARIDSAAVEARLPRRKAASLHLTDEERRGIEVRLGSGGSFLVEALDEMEATVREASRRPIPASRWQDALRGVARRLETAWISLEESAALEEAAWQQDILEIRRWRRPRWPLWLATLVVLAVAGYLGALLGGFVPVPEPLEPLTAWWWGLR